MRQDIAVNCVAIKALIVPYFTSQLNLAMGIDLPDFLLNYNGKVPITGSYREKMERNGR